MEGVAWGASHGRRYIGSVTWRALHGRGQRTRDWKGCTGLLRARDIALKLGRCYPGKDVYSNTRLRLERTLLKRATATKCISDETEGVPQALRLYGNAPADLPLFCQVTRFYGVVICKGELRACTKQINILTYFGYLMPSPPLRDS